MTGGICNQEVTLGSLTVSVRFRRFPLYPISPSALGCWQLDRQARTRVTQDYTRSESRRNIRSHVNTSLTLVIWWQTCHYQEHLMIVRSENTTRGFPLNTRTLWVVRGLRVLRTAQGPSLFLSHHDKSPLSHTDNPDPTHHSRHTFCLLARCELITCEALNLCPCPPVLWTLPRFGLNTMCPGPGCLCLRSTRALCWKFVWSVGFIDNGTPHRVGFRREVPSSELHFNIPLLTVWGSSWKPLKQQNCLSLHETPTPKYRSLIYLGLGIEQWPENWEWREGGLWGDHLHAGGQEEDRRQEGRHDGWGVSLPQ